MLKITYNFRNSEIAFFLDCYQLVVVSITDKLYLYFVGLHIGQ